MKAREICEAAAKLVDGDRRRDYGTPKENMGTIAALWSAYLGKPVTAVDVAVLLTLMKCARLKHSNNHLDSAIDIAGYAGVAGECME